jgi:hypothetical protein
MRVLYLGRQGRLKVSRLLGCGPETVLLRASLISIAKKSWLEITLEPARRFFDSKSP